MSAADKPPIVRDMVWASAFGADVARQAGDALDAVDQDPRRLDTALALVDRERASRIADKALREYIELQATLRPNTGEGP